MGGAQPGWRAPAGGALGNRDRVSDGNCRCLPAAARRDSIGFRLRAWPAREAVDRTQEWSVFGVDISPRMAALATEYVKSERFLVCSPRTFDQLLGFGVCVDFALAIWVLQHCLNLDDDIARIKAALKPSGRLLVLNAFRRLVPTREGVWLDDGIDFWGLLQEHFLILRSEQPDASVVPPGRALWGVFERR